MQRAINIFIIYAREDKEIKHRLLAHLSPFVRSYNLVLWHDEHLEAGQEWKPHIETRLEQTDLFLLLVSVDFMNSEFINQVEFKFAIDRHKTNKSVVIPIIVNYCQWDIDFNFNDYNFNLNDLQVLPTEGKPVGDWKTPEQAYNNIAAGIRKVLDTIKNKKLAEENKTADVEKETEEPAMAAEAKEDDILMETITGNDKTIPTENIAAKENLVDAGQVVDTSVAYKNTVSEKKGFVWTERKDIIGTIILLVAVLIIYLVSTCRKDPKQSNMSNAERDSVPAAQTTANKNQMPEGSKKETIIQSKTPEVNSPDEEKVFTKVEVEAGFPGGEDAWRNYLRQNLNAGIPVNFGAKAGKYTVIVKFVVSKDGRLSNIMCENDPGHGMCQEAIRVIQRSPLWTPAIQNGRNVNAYRRQPITFVVE